MQNAPAHPPQKRKAQEIAQDIWDFHLHKPPSEPFRRDGQYGDSDSEPYPFLRELTGHAHADSDATSESRAHAAKLKEVLAAVKSNTPLHLEADLDAIRKAPLLLEELAEQNEEGSRNVKKSTTAEDVRQFRLKTDPLRQHNPFTDAEDTKDAQELNEVRAALSGTHAKDPDFIDDQNSTTAKVRREFMEYAKNIRGDLMGLFRELAEALERAY